MAKKTGLINRALSLVLSFLLLPTAAPAFADGENSSLIDPEVAACESAAAFEGLKSELDDSVYLTKSIVTNMSHSGTGCVEVDLKQPNYVPLIAFKPTGEIEEGAAYYFSVWYNDLNGIAGNNNFEFVSYYLKNYNKEKNNKYKNIFKRII